MTTLSVPVLGDGASALIRFTRANSRLIVFQWVLLGLMVFIAYGGCICALYFLLKYNPEHILYGVPIIAVVQCSSAAVIGAEAAMLARETNFHPIKDL